VVAFARADSFVAQKDWASLEKLLAEAQWTELDFLRQAMLARAYREQRQEIAAQEAWRQAVRSAGEQAKSLAALARLAAQWRWEKEQEELLWQIVARFPGERWALQSLDQFYQATGNTPGLQRVYTKLLEYDPDDLIAQNNLAVVLLLLNLQTNKAHELAGGVYARNPGNSIFASTHAYSLYLRGQTNEALQVMTVLKPVQLEQPGVALYYGLLLAANDRAAEAQKYLEIARKGTLLREEKALLESAAAR
jgi:tetratricopeptide (TPR) repeat protein